MCVLTDCTASASSKYKAICFTVFLKQRAIFSIGKAAYSLSCPVRFEERSYDP